jgi:5-methylcytosine-specific restriction enzyme B
MLHPKVQQEITALHAQMEAQGEFPSAEALSGYFDTFRRRFGPDVLRRLDGQELLDVMKGPGPDGLVYWLEFKDDEELPAHFGSIAGGSALKYTVYRRKETGAWTAGAPSGQREVSTADAVAIARTHRDQLLAASDLIDALPSDADDELYLKLQRELARAAPDVQDSAWGHKYLSLIHPDKLDDYHVASYGRYHLIKVLEQPAEEDGRYVNAGRFIRLARDLQWTVNNLTTVMNRRDGSPHRYWRLGTRSGSTNQSHWDMMQTRSVVAIGWSGLGDLSSIHTADDFRDRLKASLAEKYPNPPAVIGRAAQQIVHFARTMGARDYVLASDGAEVLGIGRVTGEYQFDAAAGFPHMRPVEWLFVGSWRLPTTEGLRTTVFELRKNAANLVAIERQVLEAGELPPAPQLPPPEEARAEDAPVRTRWTKGGSIGRIQEILERKGQVILYGPPGTGKTYWAERGAHELAALWNFGKPAGALTGEERSRTFDRGPGSFVRLCTFHPGYGYEDFIQGYRPILSSGAVTFELRDGIFKSICDAARLAPEHRHYLIIDEINRGDIPRIFGELLTLLEKGKRGKSVVLPLSGKSFSVPDNVFVIGTMNTADRSIALLDAALRRRFGFVELMPDPAVLGSAVVAGIALGPWLAALNQLIVTHVGRDGRNLQVGHSYFLAGEHPIHDLHQLARVLQEDLLPLLEEYCYDDWTRLEQILGKAMVDSTHGRFRAELFTPGREDALVQAILGVAPEISASAIAVAADAGDQPTEGPPEDEDTDDGGA